MENLCTKVRSRSVRKSSVGPVLLEADMEELTPVSDPHDGDGIGISWTSKYKCQHN